MPHNWASSRGVEIPRNPPTPVARKLFQFPQANPQKQTRHETKKTTRRRTATQGKGVERRHQQTPQTQISRRRSSTVCPSTRSVDRPPGQESLLHKLETTLVQEGHSLLTNHSSTWVRSTVGDPFGMKKDQWVETKRGDFLAQLPNPVS